MVKVLYINNRKSVKKVVFVYICVLVVDSDACGGDFVIFF